MLTARLGYPGTCVRREAGERRVEAGPEDPQRQRADLQMCRYQTWNSALPGAENTADVLTAYRSANHIGSVVQIAAHHAEDVSVVAAGILGVDGGVELLLPAARKRTRWEASGQRCRVSLPVCQAGFSTGCSAVTQHFAAPALHITSTMQAQ